MKKNNLQSPPSALPAEFAEEAMRLRSIGIAFDKHE